MWSTLYHLIIYPSLLTAMRIAAFWSPKARRALRGRSDWRGPVSRIRRAASGTFRVHFHAASVGEFEQAKPLIEALRRESTKYHITASFFSPSGFESQKEYPLIDGACYIPHDRQGEMNEFMNRLSPDLIIIVRYDLWLEFMRQAKLRGIPVVLICGVLRSGSARFLFGLRRFFSSLYAPLSLVHCVSEQDREAFARLVPHVPVQVSGDTRYDRVVERLKGTEQGKKEEEGAGKKRSGAEYAALIRARAEGRKILVAGSTWPEDERLFAGLAGRSDLLLVLVPHEPEPQTVASLLEGFPGSVALSALADEDGAKEDEGRKGQLQCVIVDRMGVLAELYQAADIGYVGGGFGAGVHSLLEPAACGIPVASGPGIERSRDAVALRDAGLLRVVTAPDELIAYVAELIDRDDRRRSLAGRTRKFVEDRLGATGRILRSLHEEGFLPQVEIPFRNGDDSPPSA